MKKTLIVVAAVALLGAPAFAVVTERASPVPTSVPGQKMNAPQAYVESTKSIAAERFASNAPAAHTVTASPFQEPDIPKAALANAATSDKRATALQIGFPREIPVALRTLPLSVLPWQTQSDGSKAVKVEIAASEAAGIRVGYRFEGPDGGAQLRFAGSANPEVFKVDAVTNPDVRWSPTMEGDRGTIEVRVLKGFEPAMFKIVLEQLSHLKTSVAGASKLKAARDPNACSASRFDIGCSGSCNIDVACVINPSRALKDIASATAKYIYTEGGSTRLCTGTLINANASTAEAYFFTASHCIDNQASASSLESYWFFDAVSCRSLDLPASQRLTGGAQLRVVDPTMDVTLLALNDAPPNGAVKVGWDATVIPTNATIVSIHHPRGDLKAFSQGSVQGYVRGPEILDRQPNPAFGRDNFISVRWTDGTTEGGSSGAGLFTFDAANGFYALRGALEGGEASCDAPDARDRYSRMDLLFTKLAPYLSPAQIQPSTSGSTAVMSEFYNPQFDFYFMSSRENEKSVLDTQRDGLGNPTWYRTGYWFKTDPFASSSTASITRYFIPGAARSSVRGSHFYTALNGDKQAISNTGTERSGDACVGMPNRFFCNEGIDSFVAVPFNVGTPSATCAAGERPIYRVFRGAPSYVDDGNHRYVNNVGLYNYMVNDQRWNPESINFCARP